MKSQIENPYEWLPEMMTPDQRKIVGYAFDHLMSKEHRGWDGLDEYINFLEYLDDDQLHREADVIFTQHSHAKVKCEQDHPVEHCFIPILVDAVSAILDLYKETNYLHINNKYLLQYYLAMYQSGMIVTYDPNAS